MVVGSLGVLDRDPSAKLEDAKTTLLKYRSREAAQAAFDELTRAKQEEGFVDPRTQAPAPRRATDAEERRMDQAVARLRAHAEATGAIAIAAPRHPPGPVLLDGPLSPGGPLTRLGAAIPPTYRAFLDPRATRADGEFLVRRLHDFSDDEGAMAMAAEWPHDDAIEPGAAPPCSFLDWLEARITGDVSLCRA